MRKSTLCRLLGCAGLLLLLSGCDYFDEVVSKDVKTINITMVAKSNTNPVFLSARLGAEAAAKDLSEKYNRIDVKIDWRTPATEDASGQARLIQSPNIGSLKVSFFGPFYGGYHIIALDRENYAYAMVVGPKRSFLWILSRTKTLNQSILASLVAKAEQWGFATDGLIYVRHDRPDGYARFFPILPHELNRCRKAFDFKQPRPGSLTFTFSALPSDN